LFEVDADVCAVSRRGVKAASRRREDSTRRTRNCWRPTSRTVREWMRRSRSLDRERSVYYRATHAHYGVARYFCPSIRSH